MNLSPRSIVRKQLSRGLSSARARDWGAAELAFTEAIANAPGEWEAYVNRGNVRQERGDLDGAITDFTLAITIAPAQVAPHFNRGNVRAILGDLDGAISDFTDAITIDATFARAYERRGHILQRLGDDERAEADFSCAISLAPDRHDAYAHRAALRALRGAVEDALEDCSAAIAIGPPSMRQRDAVMRLHEALTIARRESSGREERAVGGVGFPALVERALARAKVGHTRTRARSLVYRLESTGATVVLTVREVDRTLSLVYRVGSMTAAALRRASRGATGGRGPAWVVETRKKSARLRFEHEVPRRASARAIAEWIATTLRAARRRRATLTRA